MELLEKKKLVRQDKWADRARFFPVPSCSCYRNAGLFISILGMIRKKMWIVVIQDR